MKIEKTGKIDIFLVMLGCVGFMVLFLTYIAFAIDTFVKSLAG